MEDTTKQPADASPDENDHPALGGDDIAKLMQSKGAVVPCVVLLAASQDKNGTNEETALDDLVIQREIDTTPAKNEVEKILGGPITFIGQYDQQGEGIVLMGLRGLVTESEDDHLSSSDFETMSISQLRKKCKEWGINTETMLEKQDLVTALSCHLQTLPPPNPHRLQPPLHNVRVRGDILILKVADVDDDSEAEEQGDEEEEQQQPAEAAKDDNPNAKDEEKENPHPKLEVNGDMKVEAATKPSSVEFFWPYTKEEYLKFAARTDIVAEPPTEEEEVDENEGAADEDDNSDDDDDEGDDYHDEDFVPGEDMDEEMTEDEEKSAMLNIVMSELLRKFRSDNGRGAASREVLEIRASVAEQIGVEVVTYDESLEASEEANGRKRSADGDESGPSKKKVKFDDNVIDPDETIGSEGQINDNGTETEQEKAKDKSDNTSTASVPMATPQEDQG